MTRQKGTNEASSGPRQPALLFPDISCRPSRTVVGDAGFTWTNVHARASA